MQIPLPVILTISFLVGSFSAYYAYRTGKNPVLWFAIGFIFGLWGIFAFFFAPSMKKKPVSTEPVVSFNLRGPNDKLWYYLDRGNQQLGPMSRNALIEAWKMGEIGPSTYLWHEELADWKQLSELSEKGQQ